MIQSLKKLLGLGPKVNFKDLLQNGAQIIDVRTENEFRSGHIKGSKNIPLQSLGGKLSKIKKNKTVITCCASGMRSASAKRLLQSHGFEDVHNGGGWMSLEGKIR